MLLNFLLNYAAASYNFIIIIIIIKLIIIIMIKLWQWPWNKHSLHPTILLRFEAAILRWDVLDQVLLLLPANLMIAIWHYFYSVIIWRSLVMIWPSLPDETRNWRAHRSPWESNFHFPQKVFINKQIQILTLPWCLSAWCVWRDLLHRLFLECALKIKFDLQTEIQKCSLK